MPKTKICPNCGQPLKIETLIKRAPVKDPRKIIIKASNFSSEKEIDKFLKDEKLYIKILGEFFKFREDIFLSPDELKYTVNANIKQARTLASLNFRLDFYIDLFRYTKDRLAKINKIKAEKVYITNLTTALKFLQQFKTEFPGYESK